MIVAFKLAHLPKFNLLNFSKILISHQIIFGTKPRTSHSKVYYFVNSKTRLALHQQSLVDMQNCFLFQFQMTEMKKLLLVSCHDYLWSVTSSDECKIILVVI